MKLNINKSKIVHFRNVNDKKSNCVNSTGRALGAIYNKFK